MQLFSETERLSHEAMQRAARVEIYAAQVAASGRITCRVPAALPCRVDAAHDAPIRMAAERYAASEVCVAF